MKSYFSSIIYFFILKAIVTLSLQESDGKDRQADGKGDHICNSWPHLLL